MLDRAGQTRLSLASCALTKDHTELRGEICVPGISQKLGES